MKSGEILYGIGEAIDYAYFPNRSVISMVNVLKDGTMIEVGLIGNEGMAGTSLVVPDRISAHHVVVQVPDAAVRIKAEIFAEAAQRSAELRAHVLRYMQTLFIQTAQTAACNRTHLIVQRLARWLLLVQDRTGTDSFPLTQEFIATMLGVRRSGVSEAASALAAQAAIRYRRGHITILNRMALEEISCECYQTVREEFARVMAKKP